MLTQSQLKDLLTYNPETGTFIWNITRGGSAHAGTVAGSIDTRGHVQIQVYQKQYAAHRLAFLYMTGVFPKHGVDHINRIKTDNRWCNLREATQAQNMENKTMYKNNTSGVKGVTWNKRIGKWQVGVGKNGKLIHVGYFSDLEEAKAARLKAEKELHKFNNGGG